jgi:4-aminobutyrate aminotransferase-like enzyme
MTNPLHHKSEGKSNTVRDGVVVFEPRSLRTYTPTQAVIASSAGVYHWTPEGRRLYDFSSGVLVANLGHNPRSWMQRFNHYMGWTPTVLLNGHVPGQDDEYIEALPMTAYNAVTPLEIEASKRLVDLVQSRPGGARLQQVMWAASGSEAIQKALWASMARDRTREMIVATRFGFHGKKGLAGAVTGSETDRERDPRVRFVSFPMHEYADINQRNRPFDPTHYQHELDSLIHQYGKRIGTLITEPYIGGGGSYHPPAAYLQLLQNFCRKHDIIFILDEVQANFGRTRELFAFETYGVEPDLVVLGKGLGNGVPVSAAIGRADIFNSLEYGEGSDTWSANPLCCASVLATLEEFAERDILCHSRKMSARIEAGLIRLREFPFVSKLRGEEGGMVWGVEFGDHDGRTGPEWANAFVLGCYQGDGEQGDGIHLLGPLAKKVVRISPPLTITETQVQESMALMHRCAAKLAGMSVTPRHVSV